MLLEINCLFDRKKGEPHQININTQALSNNLEMQVPPFRCNARFKSPRTIIFIQLGAQ
jgi:hypothetical protein